MELFAGITQKAKRRLRKMNENNKKAVEIPPFFYNKNVINIGIDNAGAVASLDFNKYPHLLIAGATGAGKSTILKTIIYGLLKKSEAAPAFTNFVFIDLKRVELAAFKNIPGAVFCDDFQTAATVLKQLTAVIDNTFKILLGAGVTSLKENPYLFDEVFIVIDEFAELILQDKSTEKYIVRISQLGRAAGVHLIICTQLPTAKIITNLINVNMSSKIALRVETWQNSKAIIGQKGAESLDVPGYAILKNGLNLTHFRALQTPQEDIKKEVEIWQKLKA